MNDTSEKVAGVMPSATPSEADIADWQGLPRDEQVRRLRAVLTHSDCSAVSSDSMADVLAKARAGT